jgi:hypothetical protein
MGRRPDELTLNMSPDEVIEDEAPVERARREALSAEVQLLKDFTCKRVGRGGKKSIVEKVYNNKGGVSKKCRKELELSSAELAEEIEFAKKNRPRTRGDCVGVPRPCPFVTCRSHLYLDVNPDTGNIKYNFPGLEVDELSVSCSLDVADVGPMNGDVVGVFLNVSKEAVRLTMDGAIDKIFNSSVGEELRKLF